MVQWSAAAQEINHGTRCSRCARYGTSQLYSKLYGFISSFESLVR